MPCLASSRAISWTVSWIALSYCTFTLFKRSNFSSVEPFFAGEYVIMNLINQKLHRCSQRKRPAKKATSEGGLSYILEHPSFAWKVCTDLRNWRRYLQFFFFCRWAIKRKSIEKSRTFVLFLPISWCWIYGRKVKMRIFWGKYRVVHILRLEKSRKIW